MRINVGCGFMPTLGLGWKNFDNSLSSRVLAKLPAWIRYSNPHRQKFVDLYRAGTIQHASAQHIPLPDASVEVIYSCHMFEHLYPQDARQFIAEARRVLRPGGILRLVVPDLEICAREYLSTGNADEFVENTMLATPSYSTLRSKLRFLLAGHGHHLWMYDGRSLCKMLVECGFPDAAVVPPGETRIANPAPLDLRERLDYSVYVEASRQ